MNKHVRIAMRSAAMFLAAAVIAAPARTEAPPLEKLAIVGVDVLPMTGPERLTDQTVVVDQGRILAIAPEREAKVPIGAKLIDGHGLTMIPGLVDMHVHLPHEVGAPGDAMARTLSVMLAYGVTTVRGMQGGPNDLIAREAVEQGKIAGPRIYSATPPLNDESTPTAELARAAVRDAQTRRYDLVKAHNLNTLEVWEALQDEAHQLALPTAGHVTNVVGLDRALAANQEVEHLDGSLYALLPPKERKVDWAQIPPPKIMAALARTTNPQITSLARRVAAAKGYQVPTLAAFEAIVSLSRPTSEVSKTPEMRFVPATDLKAWSDTREEMRRDGFMRGEARSFIDLRRRIVRVFSDAGVGIMAGSDTPQNFRIPGPGLIQELSALHEAGLSNIQALRSATVTPRNYFRSLPNGGSGLGWRADFGTIELGARADLILLGNDPSRDLAALKQIRAVIAGGRLYDRATLDALLDGAAASARANPAGEPATASRYESIIRTVAAALANHALVGLGDDSHRDQEAHDLQVALISDPQILCKIDAIAVEFGNGALQNIADRYVSGQAVSRDEKRRIWRDTGQWLVWDSPLYEDFFDRVRALNTEKICPKPVRVLLADPPIDWSKVHSAADYKAYRIRDEYFASVVEREILDKGLRGLIIAGDAHLWKALPAGTAEKPLMGMLVEAYAPGALASFTFPPNPDETAKAALPVAPSLTLLAGTRWGKRDFGKLVPDDEKVMMHVGSKIVGKRLDSIRWPAAERVVDGLLNLGPLTEVDPDPSVYWSDPAYLAELRRRAPILKSFYGFDFQAQLDKSMKK